MLRARTAVERERQRQTRERDGAHVIPQRVAEARDREPAGREGDDADQHEAHPERRQVEQHEARAPDDVVGPAIAVDGGQQPEGQSQNSGEQQARRDDPDRLRCAFVEDLGDRCGGAIRHSEVPLDELAKVEPVLHHDVAVEAVRLAVRTDLLVGRTRTEQQSSGVPGRDLEHEEHEEADPDQQRDRLYESLRNEPKATHDLPAVNATAAEGHPSIQSERRS